MVTKKCIGILTSLPMVIPILSWVMKNWVPGSKGRWRERDSRGEIHHSNQWEKEEKRVNSPCQPPKRQQSHSRYAQYPTISLRSQEKEEM